MESETDLLGDGIILSGIPFGGLVQGDLARSGPEGDCLGRSRHGSCGDGGRGVRWAGGRAGRGVCRRALLVVELQEIDDVQRRVCACGACCELGLSVTGLAFVLCEVIGRDKIR